MGKAAKIEKIDIDKTIKVSTEKNSLSLKLNGKNVEVILEIDDVRTNKFIAKMENGVLKIYSKGEASIERHVPALPFSKDSERLKELKKSLAYYRMVLGQSRHDAPRHFLRLYR